MPITVTLNGESRSFDASLSLQDWLDQLSIDSRYLAVELNGQIIPKSTYASVKVDDGDVVELVRFVGGG